MSSAEKLVGIIRPICRNKNAAGKITCLLTYVPVRIIRGILLHIAENIYKLKNVCKGEKIGILLSRSKLCGLPLFFKLPDGNKISLFLRDLSTFVAFKDIYDDEIYERFYILRKGDIVLDVGAHIGVFTLKACRKKCFVIAVEPDPYNFRLFRKNVTLNSYQNGVIQINAALGNEDGNAKFFKSEYFSAGSSLVIAHQSSEQISVRIYKMDTLISRLGIKTINFLKVDAEGAELDILRGARTCLKKRVIKNVSIAAYHISEPKRVQLANMLRSFEFDTVLTPYGYIYARAKSVL